MLSLLFANSYIKPLMLSMVSMQETQNHPPLLDNFLIMDAIHFPSLSFYCPLHKLSG
jgi:hypothetical protein